MCGWILTWAKSTPIVSISHKWLEPRNKATLPPPSEGLGGFFLGRYAPRPRGSNSSATVNDSASNRQLEILTRRPTHISTSKNPPLRYRS